MKIEVEFLPITETDKVLSKKKDSYHVLIHAKTAKKNEKDEKERTPFELCVVLDRSGSMNGDRLKWSKRAIRKIIKHMRTDDKLHVIMYDTYVDILFKDGDLANKEKLVDMVRSIKCKGSTNISSALEKARDILNENKSKCVKRIFLFSDGNANIGIRRTDEMKKLVTKIHDFDGITVTSFGIGSGFNEEMMKEIAVAGQGRYLFLDEKSITSEVSKAIHDMMDLIGTDAKLKFKGINGTEIQRLYANEIDSANEFLIGDIYSDNLKQILIEVSIDPTKRESKEGKKYPFLEYSFEYNSKKKEERLVVTSKIEIELTENEKEIDKSVVVHIAKEMQRVGDVNHEVLQLIKEGKTDEALKKKEEVIKDLEKIMKQDETGHVQLMINNEKESLEMMKKKETQTIEKNLGFCTYRARRLSLRCLREQEDSDSWSSEEEEEEEKRNVVKTRRRRSIGRVSPPRIYNHKSSDPVRRRSRSPGRRRRRSRSPGVRRRSRSPGRRRRSRSPGIRRSRSPVFRIDATRNRSISNSSTPTTPTTPSTPTTPTTPTTPPSPRISATRNRSVSFSSSCSTE